MSIPYNRLPCPEGHAWAGQHTTVASAWSVCQRGDWMLWWLEDHVSHFFQLAVREVALLCLEDLALVLGTEVPEFLVSDIADYRCDRTYAARWNRREWEDHLSTHDVELLRRAVIAFHNADYVEVLESCQLVDTRTYARAADRLRDKVKFSG